MANKMLLIGVTLIYAVFMAASSAHAQDADSLKIEPSSLVGMWEVEGNIMGEGGEGWVMPHKHSAPDCGNDHTIFEEGNTAKEVKYSEECSEKINTFKWELNGNTLLLSRGESTIQWHILHLDENSMRVGVQFRPNSERRMYVAYKRKE